MKQGTTRKRVYSALLKLPDRTHINFSSFALGVGIRKATLNDYLNELRQANIIRNYPTGGSTIEILDREALRKRLDESTVGVTARGSGDSGRLGSPANRPVSLVAKP